MRQQLIGTLTGYKKRIIRERPRYFQGGVWRYTDTNKRVNKALINSIYRKRKID